MSDYTQRTIKSYDGGMMDKGRQGEQIVINWLGSHSYTKEVIDMREYRISQRLDVDCGIETIDGALVLAEIKTDHNLGKTGNVLFEIYRINHFVDADRVFYLGWAFRSPAKYLLYYSPYENAIYRFFFSELRQIIGRYVSKNKPTTPIVPTDNQKTTFNILIPLSFMEGRYKKYNLNKEEQS